VAACVQCFLRCKPCTSACSRCHLVCVRGCWPATIRTVPALCRAVCGLSVRAYHQPAPALWLCGCCASCCCCCCWCSVKVDCKQPRWGPRVSVLVLTAAHAPSGPHTHARQVQCTMPSRLRVLCFNPLLLLYPVPAWCAMCTPRQNLWYASAWGLCWCC
jgi:hypothetical protein